MLYYIRRLPKRMAYMTTTLFAFLGSASPVWSQAIWYVDQAAGGASTGATWQDAFPDLHEALAAAQACDEIWIAKGTYKPDRGTKDRSMRFTLVSGVKIYGGFGGWEAKREQRDWRKNETILSGDLNGDDGPQDCAQYSNCCTTRPWEPGCDNAACEALICNHPSSWDCCDPNRLGWTPYCAKTAQLVCCDIGNWRSCENSEIVVAGNALAGDTLLDGLAIESAYVNFNAEDAEVRAGLYLTGNSRITLARCRLRGNIVGIYAHGNDITLEDCEVLDNAHWPIYVYGASDTFVLRGCTFAGNGADAATGPTTATDCLFRDNRWREALTSYGASLELRNCLFLHNSAGHVRTTSARTVIDNCLFLGTSEVGALSVGRSGATVTNSVFLRNAVRTAYGSSSSTLFRNCLFAENMGNHSAGIEMSESTVRVENCTVAHNHSVSYAAALRLDASQGLVRNSIFWGNRTQYPADPQSQFSLSDSTLTVNDSLVEHWDGSLPGVGTFDADPLFTPGPAGDYYLSGDSPAIDAGNDATADPSLFTRTTRSDEALDASPVDLGYHYPVTGQGFVLGDADPSGVVDLNDFAALQNCYDPINPDSPLPRCRIFDFNLDRALGPFDVTVLVELMKP